MNILITDIFYRKSFDVFNCLQKAFPDAHFIITSDDYGYCSRQKAKVLYKSRLFFLPKSNEKAFNYHLLGIIEAYEKQTIVYIPVEEDTTRLFLQFINEKGKHNFRFLLPDATNFDTARDKKRLSVFCVAHQIPVPQYFDKQSLRDLSDDFKLIGKPSIGSGGKGIIRTTAKALREQSSIDFEQYLVQEEIPDGKHITGTFFLYDKGKVIGSYCHKRRRTYPQEGGVTVLSEFMVNNAALQTAKKLLQKLQWSGLAMVECLYDKRDAQYKIIEVNPRLWGSILLSEFSGAALLENYVRRCTDLPLQTYPLNSKAKIRWVFPYDVINWLKGKISTKALRKNDKNTCFINGTYAGFFRSILFHITLIFNRKSLSKSLKR